MQSIFDFFNLIQNEIVSLLAVVPPYISSAFLVAFTFVAVISIIRIVGLVMDMSPF